MLFQKVPQPQAQPVKLVKNQAKTTSATRHSLTSLRLINYSSSLAARPIDEVGHCGAREVYRALNLPTAAKSSLLYPLSAACAPRDMSPEAAKEFKSLPPM